MAIHTKMTGLSVELFNTRVYAPERLNSVCLGATSTYTQGN